jgi:hypothetical protein
VAPQTDAQKAVLRKKAQSVSDGAEAKVQQLSGLKTRVTCRMFLAFLGRLGGLADQAFPMNLAWLGFSLYFRAARGVLAAEWVHTADRRAVGRMLEQRSSH